VKSRKETPEYVSPVSSAWSRSITSRVCCRVRLRREAFSNSWAILSASRREVVLVEILRYPPSHPGNRRSSTGFADAATR
jgi:hypothetical protein